MLAATLIAIFLIPVTFDVIESLSLRIRRKHPTAPSQPALPEGRD